MKNPILRLIKFLLKGKVKRYEALLKEIKDRGAVMVAKSRRSGRTEMIGELQMNDIFDSIRYEKFIKKWKN